MVDVRFALEMRHDDRSSGVCFRIGESGPDEILQAWSLGCGEGDFLPLFVFERLGFFGALGDEVREEIGHGEDYIGVLAELVSMGEGISRNKVYILRRLLLASRGRRSWLG